ncbi:MAG: hypothetical protein JWN92_3144 [Candidatus Acidoferrum typicum]|nr:hypothetical protein [Candidatus Acidoferrum typicum]
MARARKLFPIYGSALANNMFTALGRGRVVDKFVADYVADYDRRGILGGPSRDRELAETIGREAMLAMLHEIPQLLPRFFGKKQQAALKEEEKQAMDAFFLELTAALGRVWQWNGEDRRQFGHDLNLYLEFETRSAKLAQARRGAKVREEDPPFVGRVALLLDPSMLDQARRAARKFHVEVKSLARKVLTQTLHSR